MLFRQSIAVFETGEVFKEEFVLWLPLSIFDLIFHQIHFAEYPEVCSKLYFNLSKTLLSDKFKPLSESYHYSHCLYFIEMADRWFLKRPDEFLELWRMIERQVNEGKGYRWFEESWPAAFSLLFRESKYLFSHYDKHDDGHSNTDHPINDLDLIAKFVISHLNFDF